MPGSHTRQTTAKTKLEMFAHYDPNLPQHI